jgi:hypothetical protein
MAQLPVIQQTIAPQYTGGGAEGSIYSAGRAGHAIESAGSQLESITSQVIQRHDQLQLQTDDAMATDKALKWRDGARVYISPVDGVLATKGADASGITKQAEKDLNAMADSLSGELQNDRQKALFHHAIGLDLESKLNSVAEHEASARDQFYQDTSKAVVASAIEDAVGAADNPKAQGVYMQRMENEIRSNPEGLPPAAVEFQVKTARSKVFAGTTQALAYRDPTTATQYLDQHKDDVLGTDRLQLEQAIDSGLRTRMAAQDHAMALQDRADRKTKDARAAEGDALLFSGGMTADWIAKNSSQLNENDQRYFYNELANPRQAPEVRSQSDVLATLWTRKAKGEDVGDDARTALQNKTLSQSDYKQLMPLGGDRAEAPWVKFGNEQIRAITGMSEMNQNEEVHFAYGNAMADWRDWVNSHPDAKEKDAIDAAQFIASHYRSVAAGTTMATLKFPRTMNGNLAATQDTANRLAQAYQKFAQVKDSMSEADRLDEADRLEKMRLTLHNLHYDMPPPAKPAAAKPATGAVPGVAGATYGGKGSTVFGGIPPASGAPAEVAPAEPPAPSAAPAETPAGF